MAYPFNRSHSSPQTPHFIKSRDSPRLSPALPRKRRMSYTRSVLLAIVSIAALVYCLRSFTRDPRRDLDRIPFTESGITDYFTRFEGRQDCALSSLDLYAPPVPGPIPPFCPNRATLLEALSSGGRHGYDAPFTPKSCHYRWYSTPEICMILDRFSALIFIGDSPLQSIYTSLNILLRENLALGGLAQWSLSDADRATCRCNNQFIKPSCQASALHSSKEVLDHDAASPNSSPFLCSRVPHVYIPLTESPPSPGTLEAVTSFLASPSGGTASPSSYKPIPIILSQSLSTSLSWPATTASMDALALAILSTPATRAYPVLWLGPKAAGHLKPPGKILAEGNNALWHFTHEMGREARSRGWDSLGLYNMTLQATSWDGTGYGIGTGLVQAMGVVGWLARVEST